MYVLRHLQYSTIQLHKHITYAQYALNNSATGHGEDEIHLCKKLCIADFAHENFGSTPASMHPSVSHLFPSSLLQGLLPVPPVGVPAQTNAGDLWTPKDNTSGSISQQALSTLDPSVNCVTVCCEALWLSLLRFWVTQ